MTVARPPSSPEPARRVRRRTDWPWRGGLQLGNALVLRSSASRALPRNDCHPDRSEAQRRGRTSNLRERSEVCRIPHPAFRNSPKTEKPPMHLPRRLLVEECRLSLSHPERLERRFVDHRCGDHSLIGLIPGERRAGERSEQSIHFAFVIAHLLKHGLHFRDHFVWR